MNRKMGSGIVSIVFVTYQIYLHTYVEKIGMTYRTLGGFLQDNVDEISQYLLLFSVFFMGVLYFHKAPLQRPEFRIRLGSRLPRYVLRESLLRGAVSGTIFFILMMAVALWFGYPLHPISYLGTVWGRVVLYGVSVFFLYWALYLMLGKEVVAMLTVVLFQWTLSISIILYSFYVPESVFGIRSARMAFFQILQATIAALSLVFIYIGAKREALSP